MSIGKKLLLLIVVLTGSFIVVAPTLVQAQNSGLFESSKSQACRGANLSGSANCDTRGASNRIGNTIETIINILSIIVGIAAVILIIINGLRFITSNGDAGSISAARNGVIYAIVGLIVVAVAQLIVRFIISKI